MKGEDRRDRSRERYPRDRDEYGRDRDYSNRYRNDRDSRYGRNDRYDRYDRDNRKSRERYSRRDSVERDRSPRDRYRRRDDSRDRRDRSRREENVGTERVKPTIATNIEETKALPNESLELKSKSTQQTPSPIPNEPEETIEMDSDEEMKRIMGFGNFDTTHNKHVQGGQVVIGVQKQRRHKQFMNRFRTHLSQP